MKKQFIDLFLLSLVFFMALSPLVKAEETLFDEPPPPFLPPFPYDDFEKPTILDENGEPITGVKKNGLKMVKTMSWITHICMVCIHLMT